MSQEKEFMLKLKQNKIKKELNRITWKIYKHNCHQLNEKNKKELKKRNKKKK